MAEGSAVSRISRRPLAAVVALLMGLVVVPVATSTASAAPARAAQAGDACLSVSSPPSADPDVETIPPYSNERSPLLLPAWADAAGWANPSQYETILAGDIDGDGYGDLLGRNASVLEAHTWSPPLRPGAGGVDDPNASPFPGQWIPKAAADPPQVHESGTQASMLGEVLGYEANQVQARLATVVPGFADPSRHETFRLGNFDGVPGDEVLVRQPRFADAPIEAPYFWPTGSGAPAVPPTYLGTFLAMYRYDATTRSWTGPVWGPPVPDSPPISDDKAPGGSSVPYGHQTAISATGWWWEQFYDTLTVVDVDRDGTDELITRGPDLTRSGIDPTAISAGLTTWSYDPASGTFEPLAAPQNLMNTDQGFSRDAPWQYSTLRTGDLDPTNPGEELVAQFANASSPGLPDLGPGLQLFGFNGTEWAYRGDVAGATATLFAWSTTQDWTQKPAFYETIGVADLVGDGQGDAVFALEPSGLRAYRFDGTQWQALVASTSTDVLSGDTWTGTLQSPPTKKDDETAPYYSTIQAADVIGTPAEEILARGPDGIQVFSYDPAAKAFRDMGISLTAADGVALSDDKGWNAPMRYESITTAPTEPNKPRALIARDLTGVRTYVLPDAQATQWVSPSSPYPAWANGPNADDYVPAGVAAGYPAARAYNFVNEEVGDQLWPVPTYPGQPAVLPATIRSRFLDLGQDLGTVADRVASLRPRGLNITRAEWEDVQQQMGDWSLSVQRLRGYFFDASGSSSLEQILESSLVVGNTAYSAQAIEAQFNAQDRPQLWAVLGDIIWGVFGGLPTGGSGELAFMFSMAGAGAGVGGTLAPSGKYQQALNLEAEHLDEAIAASFCVAIDFLYGSHDQAVADLGLLTAMDIAISQNPVTSEVALQARAAATRGRAVWIYQQFAANSSRKEGGWRMAAVPATCVEDRGADGCVYNDATKSVNKRLADGAIVGAYYVYPANNNCGSDKDGLQTNAFTTLTEDLQVDPLDMATPSWTFWDGDVNSQGPGQPQVHKVTVGTGDNAEQVDVVGTLGWRNQLFDGVPGECTGPYVGPKDVVYYWPMVPKK